MSEPTDEEVRRVADALDRYINATDDLHSLSLAEVAISEMREIAREKATRQLLRLDIMESQGT